MTMTKEKFLPLIWHLRRMLVTLAKEDAVTNVTELDDVYNFKIGDDISISVSKTVLDKKVADARERNKS